MLPSSCVTPAGTSIEVQNEWEENTHTHTRCYKKYKKATGFINNPKTYRFLYQPECDYARKSGTPPPPPPQFSQRTCCTQLGEYTKWGKKKKQSSKKKTKNGATLQLRKYLEGGGENRERLMKGSNRPHNWHIDYSIREKRRPSTNPDTKKRKHIHVTFFGETNPPPRIFFTLKKHKTAPQIISRSFESVSLVRLS